MKYKLLALILTVTIVSWTQTATQSTSSALQENTAPDKAKCPGCDKMASSDAKDAHAACMRKHDGKEMASCCSGKDAKSCCNGKEAKCCMNDDKAAASCCKDCCGKEKDKTPSCCRKSGKECGKGCCGTNKSEKPA